MVKRAQAKRKTIRENSLIGRGFRVYYGTQKIQGIPKLRFSLGSNPSLMLFGDESKGDGTVVYAVVALPEAKLKVCETQFRETIKSAGGLEGSRFHCNEVFGKSRDKTIWNHKTEEEMWNLAAKLMADLKSNFATFFVGVVYSHTYPTSIPDGEGKIITLSPEHFYGLAFRGVTECMRSIGIFEDGIGKKLWIDRQVAKVNLWGIGKIPISDFLRDNSLTPEECVGEKPILLDAADILAYVAGRATSRTDSRNKQQCLEIYEMCDPNRINCAWIPPESEANAQNLLA